MSQPSPWRPRVWPQDWLSQFKGFRQDLGGASFQLQPMPNYLEISRACDGSQEKGQYRHRDGKCKDPTGHLHISGNCLQRVWRLVAKLTICSLYSHSTASCIQFDRTAIQAVLNALRLEEVNAQAATWRPEQQFSNSLLERDLKSNSQHWLFHTASHLFWEVPSNFLWRNSR